MMSLHTETQLRLRGCGKRLGGDSISPRQSLAQPSLAPTKDVDMFRVTEDWITRNATRRGGYKAAQLKAIGVSWPPAGGWKRRASGKLITLDAKEVFESYAGGNPVTGPSVFVPLCNCTTPPWEECEHTDALAERAMREMMA
jgi:hypothetical protein